MNKTKNEIAWERLFDRYNIPNRIKDFGSFEITSNQISDYREPRLMTKYDHRAQLPRIFKEYELSILPIARGAYIIGNFEVFHDLQSSSADIETIVFPSNLESLVYNEINSEATAINCAFVSKLLHTFLSEESLFPTVSGRMGSSDFDFKIISKNELVGISVKSSQVEIDGGYEGEGSLTLIEAKNFIADDFLIRQLYYPYRLWVDKIQKKVRPVFMTYSNGIFHLREYSFENLEHYNSIRMIKQGKYMIQNSVFNIEVLEEIINQTEIVDEPNVPFPQADSFERVINLCEMLNEREYLSKEDITSNYGFDTRQTDYYSNAAKYLGMVKTSQDKVTKQVGCSLSDSGKAVFQMNLNERQRKFVQLIVSHCPFRTTILRALENGKLPEKEEVVEIMKQCNILQDSKDSTFVRRSSTIIGWVNWILEQLET